MHNIKVLNCLLFASVISIAEYTNAIRVNVRFEVQPEPALTKEESQITYDVIKDVQKDDDDVANEVMDELGFSTGVTNHYLSQQTDEKAAPEAPKKADDAKPAGEEAKAPADGEKPETSEGDKPAAKKGEKAKEAE